jgi:hydroxymethylbilane synthase
MGHSCEIVTISTLGDRVTDKPFDQIGAPGVFVREIEASLLAGDIDLAVHSYKDLPTVSPEGLVIAAVPERLDPADILVVDERHWDEQGERFPLGPGLQVGTSSARRRALIRDLRPDLVPTALRGNVPTRLRKCLSEQLAAVVLAASGLQRLWDAGLSDLTGLREFRLSPDIFVPAPSQGALAVQTRAEGSQRAAVAALDEPAARAAVEAERAVLAGLEGGCQSAIGAWLQWRGEDCTLYGAFERGDSVYRARAEGALGSLDSMAQQVVEDLQS